MKYACITFFLLPMKIQYLYCTVQDLLYICFQDLVIILFGLKSDSVYLNNYYPRKIIQSTF
jgi:hypothetical protein